MSKIEIGMDSRKIGPGYTFVAIKGAAFDGHDYIKQAVEKGATTVVVEKDVEEPILTENNVEVIKVPDTAQYLVDELSKRYQDQINSMDIVGITGTNGKTTTAYLAYQLLNQLGTKTAYIGTIGSYIPGEEVVELPNTTPNIVDLYGLMLDALEKGCKTLIMEVTSHALVQRRTYGIDFKVGAFTNLTQDHLDYHNTMENYLEAKLKLLDQLHGPMIINVDDSHASAWRKEGVDIRTLGYQGQNYQMTSYENNPDGTKINFNVDGESYQVDTNLKNEFNVYNYMTTLAIAHELGYKIPEIIAATKDVYPPRGRCEMIKVDSVGALAVIDYAHTPDAVEKIVTSFNAVTEGKVYTLVGCGGDRDPMKRPVMGRIATENSDFVVFTSDNPRTEDPRQIIENILEGVTLNNYEVVVDRKEAIEYIVGMLEAGDTLLVLGKGHESYQVIGTERKPFDDATVVKEAILSLSQNRK